MRLHYLYFLILFLISPVVLQAQKKEKINTEELVELSLEDLLELTVISASKKEESILDAPSNVTVITDKQIKKWGSRDIKDVMRRVAGFQVIADRDEWVFASRGNVSDNNSKYLILIDGHRTNSIENFGPGQLIELPNNLSNVKRIEIIKGPGSAVWGADALAGIINIITKNAEDFDYSTNAALTYGSDNYMVADFQIAKQVNEDVDFAVMASFSKQDGREIDQQASTGLPILEESFNNFTNPLGTYKTDLDRHNFGYFIQFKANVGKFSFNSYSFETETHNRQFESNRGRENWLTTNKSFIEGQYNDEFWNDGRITVKLATESNYAEYRPGKQGSSTILPINIAWRDRGIYTEVSMQKPFNEKVNVISGVDYKFTKLGPNHRINSINPDSSSLRTIGFWFDRYNEDHQLGGYAMLNYAPIDQLSVTLGSRADFNNQRGNDKLVFNPRLALVYKPIKTASFKVLYNQGYLRPVNFQAADNVNSEVMKQLDLVWLQQFNNFNYTVTAYSQKLEGFINITNGFGFKNTGDYVSSGVEIEANYNLSDQVNFWGNISISNPRGENFPDTVALSYNGRRVDLDGDLLSYAGMNFNIGNTTRFMKGKFFISPAVRFLGATKYRVTPVEGPSSDREENYKETDPFFYLDVNLGYEPNDKTGLYFYIDNLTNITTPTHTSVWNGTIGQYGTFFNVKARFKF